MKLLALLLLAGCFEDKYRCTNDAQCNVGEGGRCEVDGYCTKFDDQCDTERRYVHAGEHGDSCYDDRVVPANRCAGGQPPARPEGCLANVCTRLKACCDIAWTDACAQLAQEECTDLVCDTRIAITAAKQMTTELWNVTWTGGGYDIRPETNLLGFGWIAPAPGETAPRIAGQSATELVLGERRIPFDPNRTIAGIATIDLDRDARDTIVVSHNNVGADHTIDIYKPDGPVRSLKMPASANLTWGDIDRDGYPDAITRGGAQYYYLPRIDGEAHKSDLEFRVMATVAGGTTPGAPIVRQIDWLDFDGDALTDLAVFGGEVRIHTNGGGLREQAEFQIDCDLPETARSCSTEAEPNLEQASFGGAALPNATRPEVIVSMFPGRKLFHVYERPAGNLAIDPFPFPGDSCTCTPQCDMQTCPGPDCTCNYNCNTCVPIIGLVVRDLDGDHRLDIVAIDARLAIYNALAKDNYVFNAAGQIPTALVGNVVQIGTSVTGAPR